MKKIIIVLIMNFPLKISIKKQKKRLINQYRYSNNNIFHLNYLKNKKEKKNIQAI